MAVLSSITTGKIQQLTDELTAVIRVLKSGNGLGQSGTNIDHHGECDNNGEKSKTQEGNNEK